MYMLCIFTLKCIWFLLFTQVIRVSVEKSAGNLMGVLLYVICHFSLVDFNILSLSLISVSFITLYMLRTVVFSLVDEKLEYGFI